MATVTVSLVLAAVLLSACEGSDLFVSHSGNDTTSCGHKRNSPCHTIVYAIQKSQANDVIHIENTGGPYTVVPPGGRYVKINHTVTLMSVGQGRVTLTCNTSTPALFEVVGADDKARRKTKPVTLNLVNIVVTGCKSPSWDVPSVIRIYNAYVNIKQCQFVNNGVLLDHSNLTDGCGHAKLVITGSKFTSNGFSKPFMPAINLDAYESLEVIISHSQLQWTPLKFKGGVNMSVTMDNTVMDGQGLRADSLSISLGTGVNRVAMSNSIVMNHQYSRSSAVTVSANQRAATTPSVHFNTVTFHDNTQSNSLGGALSLISRFDYGRNVAVGAQLNNCTFVGNSASRHRAGAVYVEGVSDVMINGGVFTNNSADEGGAIFVTNTRRLTVLRCRFEANSAAKGGAGGAVRASYSSVTVQGCHFSNNTAGFMGQDTHFTDMVDVTLTNNSFVSGVAATANSRVLMYVQQAKTTQAQTAVITTNTFSLGSHDGLNHIYLVEAVSYTVGSYNNSVCCPTGQQLRRDVHSSAPVHTSDVGLTYSSAWCSGCPTGQYSLQRKCSSGETPLTCKTCPEYGVCDGNSAIRPLRNYWGRQGEDNGTTVSFHTCPYRFCDKRNCTDITCCSGGRVGRLCGSCPHGQHFDVAKQICTENCNYKFKFLVMYSLAFSAIYTIVITLFALTTRANMGPAPTPLHVQDPTLDLPQPPGSSDSHSDSFEPSVEFTRSADSHGLIPVTDGETQTSRGLSDSAKSTSDLPYPNLIHSMPFVVCVWLMLIQLLEEVYKPGYAHSTVRSTIITSIMDLFNFRPVFLFLDAPCGYGRWASMSRWTLGLLCIGGIYGILILFSLATNGVLWLVSRRRDVTRARAALNSLIYHVLMAVIVSTHVPLLKASFRLIHCVSIEHPGPQYMFQNAEMVCHQWWHWLIIAIIIVVLAPCGLTLWMGLQLLKSNNLSSCGFLASLVLPLPSIVYWECRYAKRICRCLRPYDYFYARMQITSVELDRANFPNELSITTFFSAPFHNNNAGAGTKSGSSGWIIYLFLRSFIVVTFATLLDHDAVTRSTVLFSALLLAMALHVHCRPYSVDLANQLELGLLGVLTFLSILGLHNAAVYSAGVAPYTHTAAILTVFDWIYVITLLAVVAELIVVVMIFSVKACLVNRRMQQN